MNNRIKEAFLLLMLAFASFNNVLIAAEKLAAPIAKTPVPVPRTLGKTNRPLAIRLAWADENEIIA